MNTVYPRLSDHALISALPRISAYSLFHNVKKASPPLWISAHLFPHFLSGRNTRKNCFYWHVWVNNDRIGLQRLGNVHRYISSWLQLVTDRIWNKAKILSFADEKIRFLLTCFFIFVYSVLFQFSALMSETAFSQGFFICTWYLFDVSIWILLFPVIIRLYLGRGTKIFLTI